MALFSGGGGGITEHEMCILIFCTTFAQIISRSTKNRVRYSEMYIGVHVKYQLFLPDLNET